VLPLIVPRAAAATYFPKATAIPGSHFSVAKPPTRTATVNNYLLEFVTTHNLMSSADGQNDEEVSPVATPRSKYPTPHLQLTIEDPANSQMRISPTREMQPDVTREINRIAQKHEIPAFADVKEILSQLPSKSAWHEEWINYELPENASQEQRYAKTLYEWWFSTRAKLCERHRMETIAARGGPLTLTLRNTGTAHAKGLRIYVWIPNWADMSSLASAGSQYYQLPGGDKKHFAIEVDFYGRSATISSGRTTVTPNTATLYLERSEFTQTETAYRAFPGELSHGDKVQLSTLRVSVKLEPAKDIRVRYRLHAENQPKDTEGAFILKVTEEAGKL
jgi:hypothetical protein